MYRLLILQQIQQKVEKKNENKSIYSFPSESASNIYKYEVTVLRSIGSLCDAWAFIPGALQPNRWM